MTTMVNKIFGKGLLYLVACALLLVSCVLWMTGVLMFVKELRSQMAQGMDTGHSWYMLSIGVGALIVTVALVWFFFRRYQKLSKKPD
jgi:putative solute:sodium symporter small subunit